MFDITFPMILLGLMFLFITGYSIWLIQALYKRIRHGVPGDRQAARIPVSNAPLSAHRIDRKTLSGVTVVGSILEGKARDEDMIDMEQQNVEVVYLQSEMSMEGSSLKGMPLSDLSHLKSNPNPAFQKYISNYMTMGLRKLDEENWLTIDSEYYQYYTARRELLSEAKQEVLQCLPGGEAACEELLGVVTQFLTKKYPKEYDIFEGHIGQEWIRNKVTGEEFSMKMPYNLHPLEVVARLVVEDFNILIKSEFAGHHHLLASATFFPAGWRLRDRIGSSVMEIHGPVPQWEDKLSKPVEHRLNQTSFMERSSFFVQVRPPGRSLAETLFVQEPKDFFPGNVNNLWPRDVIIRRERQTFRRLPKTNAIVFTVKTSITPLTQLPKEELKELAAEIRSWPENIANYKGRSLWERPVLEYCDGTR